MQADAASSGPLTPSMQSFLTKLTTSEDYAAWTGGWISISRPREEEERKVRRVWRINSLGTNVIYGAHDKNAHNLVKGLITRLFTVKYNPAIVAYRAERDIRAVREAAEKHFGGVENLPLAVESFTEKPIAGSAHCVGAQLSRLLVAAASSLAGERGIPFPPVVGAYDRPLPLKFRELVTGRCPSTAPIAWGKYPEYYSGRKRQIYEAANEVNLRECVERGQSGVKVFTKLEKLNFTSKEDPDPRIIQPRDPRYNIAVGRFIKHMEGPLCKAVGKVFGHTTITKGLNASQAGSVIYEKWCMFKDPVAVGLDASRFDQHTALAALMYEHGFYIKLLSSRRNRKRLAKLLSWQLVNTGKAFFGDMVVKYQTLGSRGSGDVNTGMGNCLLACALIWCYLQEKGINGSLVNNGDDCVVFMERSDLASFSHGLLEWFSDYGYTMEVEAPVDRLERVVFCQASPVYDGSGWRMVRDPRTSMSKDAMCLIPLYSETSFATWLEGVGMCGEKLAGDMPVLGAYYRSMIRSANQITPRRNRLNEHLLNDTGMRRLAEGMTHIYKEPTQAARESFHAAFGVLPDVQVEIEQHYNSIRIQYGTDVSDLVGGVTHHFSSHTYMGLLS